MSKLAIALSAVAALLATPALSAGFYDLPSAKDFVPTGSTLQGKMPNMGEVWAPGSRTAGLPSFCVMEGKLICIIYPVNAAATASWRQNFEISAFPVPDHIVLRANSTGPTDLVIFFTSQAEIVAARWELR